MYNQLLHVVAGQAFAAQGAAASQTGTGPLTGPQFLAAGSELAAANAMEQYYAHQAGLLLGPAGLGYGVPAVGGTFPLPSAAFAQPASLLNNVDLSGAAGAVGAPFGFGVGELPFGSPRPSSQGLPLTIHSQPQGHTVHSHYLESQQLQQQTHQQQLQLHHQLQQQQHQAQSGPVMRRGRQHVGAHQVQPSSQQPQLQQLQLQSGAQLGPQNVPGLQIVPQHLLNRQQPALPQQQLQAQTRQQQYQHQQQHQQPQQEQVQQRLQQPGAASLGPTAEQQQQQQPPQQQARRASLPEASHNELPPPAHHQQPQQLRPHEQQQAQPPSQARPQAQAQAPHTRGLGPGPAQARPGPGAGPGPGPGPGPHHAAGGDLAFAGLRGAAGPGPGPGPRSPGPGPALLRAGQRGPGPNGSRDARDPRDAGPAVREPRDPTAGGPGGGGPGGGGPGGGGLSGGPSAAGGPARPGGPGGGGPGPALRAVIDWRSTLGSSPEPWDVLPADHPAKGTAGLSELRLGAFELLVAESEEAGDAAVRVLRSRMWDGIVALGIECRPAGGRAAAGRAASNANSSAGPDGGDAGGDEPSPIALLVLSSCGLVVALRTGTQPGPGSGPGSGPGPGRGQAGCGLPAAFREAIVEDSDIELVVPAWGPNDETRFEESFGIQTFWCTITELAKVAKAAGLAKTGVKALAQAVLEPTASVPKAKKAAAASWDAPVLPPALLRGAALDAACTEHIFRCLEGRF